MTKSEAHEIMKQVIKTVRDKTTYEAMYIALKALAWECAHEKLMNISIGDENGQQ